MTSYDMTSSRVGTLAWAERTGGILSRGERIGLLGDAVRLQMRILPAQTRALLRRTNRRAFSVDPDRLSVPDTTIAREAEALCSGVSTPALLNHCLRSYAWGTILAARDGLEHDSELLYVTCLLHDLGVTDRYRDTVSGQACFAATAATIARDWSRERDWREPRCRALADAICQHINPAVPPRTRDRSSPHAGRGRLRRHRHAALGGGHAHRQDCACSPSPARLQEVFRQRHVRAGRSPPRHPDALPLSLPLVWRSHQPGSLRGLTDLAPVPHGAQPQRLPTSRIAPRRGNTSSFSVRKPYVASTSPIRQTGR